MNWFALLNSQALAAGSSFLPPQGTAIAADYDSLYAFIVAASAISCAILIGGMIYFAVKYKRRSNNDKTAYITHNSFLEFLWSFIPLVIFMVVFGWGWTIYNRMRTFPENALEVHVFGHQWAWDFEYKSGKVSGNEFYVPVGEPVKLIMTSKDVIHSFFIPSMRLKQDVVPGRYSALGFTAEKTGDYQIFCSQYCGSAHSNMLAKMHVVSREDYEKWLQEKDDTTGMTMAQKGEKLYNTKGCVACHSVDGSPRVGPSWKGAWGGVREVTDGRKLAYNEEYFRNCVLNPSSKTVKGYPAGVMPSQQGLLNDEQIASLIEFVKTLK
jgi:cytochrome c oxidase subunit 2